MNTKSQTSGSPAAVLILAIAAFIVLFILLLPQEDRENLLDSGPGSSGSSGIGAEISGVLLLEENPGTISKVRTRQIERDLASFVIRAEEEDIEMKKLNYISLRTGESDSKEVYFETEDGASNGALTFEVADSKGVLTIELNGEEIFKGSIEKNAQIEPFSLPEIDEDNTLKFYVDSPPAWKFWEKNYYEIRKVRIVGTVKNDEGSQSFQTFIMSKEEADPQNIQDVFLQYGVACSVSYGKIEVRVNNYLISSRVPECESPVREKEQVDPGILREGKNEIVFTTVEGEYGIDRPKIQTTLKKPIYPLYFFNLNESMHKKISGPELTAQLIINFAADGQEKKAILSVNGHETFVDTRKNTHSKNIDEFLKEGNNYIRVVPESNALHITEMVVAAKK